MNLSSAQRELMTLCALAHDGQRLDWSLIAREALVAGGVEAMVAGEFRETSPSARTARALMPSLAQDRARAEQRVLDEIALAEGVDARLVTVIDDGYPSNLKLIPNLPPFLFVGGRSLRTMPGQWLWSGLGRPAMTVWPVLAGWRVSWPIVGLPSCRAWRSGSTPPLTRPRCRRAAGPSQ